MEQRNCSDIPTIAQNPTPETADTQSPTPMTDREKNINMPPTHTPPPTQPNTISQPEKALGHVPRIKAAQNPAQETDKCVKILTRVSADKVDQRTTYVEADSAHPADFLVSRSAPKALGPIASLSQPTM